MEPPAKRARLDEPPYYEHRHVDDVVIDPQLSHGVHEKEGVNGPSLTHEEGGEGDFAGKSEIDLEAEYILEQQRAKAGSRFQQAMASIFDKYSRDFADVGDEIDLATGQVIVDNGHLANMRYEGDLGIDDGTTTDGHDDGDDNDDEGTLLEDWVDDDEDEGVRLEDLPDDWDGPSGAVLGGAIPPSSPEPPAASNPHGGPNQLPFSPADNVSMGLDPDSSSFDAPPLNLRPWGFLGHVDGAEWESLPKPKQKTRPQPQPQPRLNTELKTKPKPKPRIASGTTVYRGGKSIWDPDPGYVDEWGAAPSRRGGARPGAGRKPKLKELPALPPVSGPPTIPQENPRQEVPRKGESTTETEPVLTDTPKPRPSGRGGARPGAGRKPKAKQPPTEPVFVPLVEAPVRADKPSIPTGTTPLSSGQALAPEGRMSTPVSEPGVSDAPKPKSGRGGARPGAGRPRKIKPPLPQPAPSVVSLGEAPTSDPKPAYLEIQKPRASRKGGARPGAGRKPKSKLLLPPAPVANGISAPTGGAPESNPPEASSVATYPLNGSNQASPMRDRLIKGPIARIKGRKSAVASKIRRRRWGIAKAYKRRMPTVEEDLPGDDDDGDNNDDNCRRSGRDRRPVDFLGKIPWSEVLGFDVQNPLAASLYAEGVFDDGDGYESINSEEDEGEDEAEEEEEEQAQSLPTPPESGHDTSDNEPHPWQSLLPTPGPAATEASQSSDRITTIPDSQGTEQSPLPVRTISRPQRQPTPEPPSVRVEYATGDASCMLSDDEQPVLFKRPKRKLQQLQQPSKQKPPQEKAPGFAAISSRPQPSTAVAAYTTTAPLTTPTEAELPKKRGRPRKASTEEEPPASLPPDDGALRKKLKVSAEGHASKQMPKATFAPNAAAEGTKRKRGRLRKEPLPDPERCPAPVPSTQTLPDGPATIKAMTAVGSAEDEETGPLSNHPPSPTPPLPVTDTMPSGEVTGHGQPTLGEIELGEPFDDQSTAAPLENEQPRLATDKADTLPVDASPRADTSLPVASPPGTPAPSSDDLLLDASTPSTSVPDEFTLEACLPDVFVPKKSAPDAPTSVSNDPVTVAEKPTPNEAAMDASAPHEPVPNVDAPATYTPAPNAPSEPAVDKSAPSIEAPDVVSVPEDEPVPYVPQFETATSEMSVTKTPTPVIPAPSVSSPIPLTEDRYSDMPSLDAPASSVPQPEYKSPSPSVVVERGPTPKVLTPKAATPVESMPVIALPNDPTPRECTPKVPSPRVLTPRAPRPKSPTPERPTPKTSAPTISAPSVPGKSTPRHTPDRVIQDSQETDSSPAKPQTPPKDSNITQRAEPPASSKEEGRRRLFKETPPAAAAAAQETASGSRAAAVAAPASRDGSRQRPAEKVVVAIPDGTEAATSLKKPAEKIRQQPTTHEHTGPRATSSPTPPLQGRQGQQPKLKLKLRPKPKPQSQLQPQAQPPPPQPRQQRHSPPTVVASGTAKPKHRDTTRLSSSSSRRRSILSLVPPTGPSSFSSSKKNRRKSYIDDDDDDDDDFLGRADDTVSVSKLFSSNTPQPPAAREKSRRSGDAQTTTEVSVAKDGGSGSSGSSSRKRRRSEAAAAGPKKMCGVDGYKCGKDFCFTCL